jgi:hypothetical protein
MASSDHQHQLAAPSSAETTAQGGEPPSRGWCTVSARAAAEQLAGRGADPATARAVVADYLRETSERVGAPVDEWGLDQGDIAAIAAAHRLPAAAARAVAEQDDADTRAAQLTQWHTDDHPETAADATTTDAAAASTAASTDGFADGLADDAGWSR